METSSSSRSGVHSYHLKVPVPPWTTGSPLEMERLKQRCKEELFHVLSKEIVPGRYEIYYEEHEELISPESPVHTYSVTMYWRPILKKDDAI